MTRPPQGASSPRVATGRPHPAGPKCAAGLVCLLLCGTAPARLHGVQPTAAVARPTLAERPAAEPDGRRDARLAALESDSGSRWSVAWDAATAAARWGTGGPASHGAELAALEVQARAARFLDAHAELLGAVHVELAQVRFESTPGAWHVTQQQQHEGRRVLGAWVDLTLRSDGEVIAFHSRLVPRLVAPRQASRPSEAVASVERSLGVRLGLESSEVAVALEFAPGRIDATQVEDLVLRGPHGARWRALVESSSLRLLHLESLVRTHSGQPAVAPPGADASVAGRVHGLAKPMYAHDALQPYVFPWLAVQLRDAPEQRTFTDAAGAFQLDIGLEPTTLDARLEGRYVSVHNQAGDLSLFRSAAVPGTRFDILFDASNSRDDERTIYYHTNIIHDYASATLQFTAMDYPVPAVASVHNPNNGSANYANAFWDGQRMGFGNGGGGMNNFGLFADVVYHEYTHGITDFMYRPIGGLIGPIGAAIHEGLSDYFACTLTNEPLLGEFLSGTGALRNLENTLLWPEDRDAGNEPHANGEILAGALWDVRDIIGPAAADRVAHAARQHFPQTFEEYLEAMLLQDDVLFGDGVPGNGSPHRQGILAGFGIHGMGALGSRDVRIVHAPLGDSEDAGAPRRVQVQLGTLAPRLIDEVYVHYSSGGAFTPVRMTPLPQARYEAEIPGLPAGSQVEYYLSAVRLRPRQVTTLPANAPVSVFTFAVGEDVQPPVIEHVPFAQVAAFVFPPEIGVRIADNLGIASAYVEYTRNGVDGARLGLVRVPGTIDAYRGAFPNAGGQAGDVFEYRIIAVDASRAAHETRLPLAGTFRFDLVHDLDDGFEQGSSWGHQPAADGRADAWHLSAARNHTSAGMRAWHCGSFSAEYAPGTAAVLASDWYLLGASASAHVWSWMDAEPNGPAGAFDGGIVQIHSDAGTSLLVPTSGYPRRMAETAGTNVLEPGTPCLSGRSTAWERLEFDLSAYAGQRVQIRFVFAADNVATPFGYAGWTLDDFALAPGDVDPTATGETPASGRQTLLAGPPSPNPFNPHVRFVLRVPAPMHVQLDILDVRGRLVRALLDASLPAGPRGVIWDGSDARQRAVASGVYYYRVRSALGTDSGRVILAR